MKKVLLLLMQVCMLSTVAMAQSHCDSLRYAFFEDMRGKLSGRSYTIGDYPNNEILTLYRDSVFEWRNPWYFEYGEWSMAEDSIICFSSQKKVNKFIKSEKEGGSSLQLYYDNGKPLMANVVARLENGECVDVACLNDMKLYNMFMLPEHTVSVTVSPSSVTQYFEMLDFEVESSNTVGKGVNYIGFIDLGKNFDGVKWLKRGNKIYQPDDEGEWCNEPLCEKEKITFYCDTLPGENIYQKRSLSIFANGTYSELRLAWPHINLPVGEVGKDYRWRSMVYGKELWRSEENGDGKWYITDDHRLKLVPSSHSDKAEEKIFIIKDKELINTDTQRSYMLQDIKHVDYSE